MTACSIQIRGLLSKISDLGQIKNRIHVGFTLEFSDRQDGYRAIQKGNIQLVDAYSTDSELRQYKLMVLDDDKHVFPPYQGAPLIRQETLKEYPEIEALSQQARWSNLRR